MDPRTSIGRSSRAVEERGYERQRGDREVQRAHVTWPIVGIAGYYHAVPPSNTAARRTGTWRSRKGRVRPLRRVKGRYTNPPLPPGLQLRRTTALVVRTLGEAAGDIAVGTK